VLEAGNGVNIFVFEFCMVLLATEILAHQGAEENISTEEG
jgi:hypothetical protein